MTRLIRDLYEKFEETDLISLGIGKINSTQKREDSKPQDYNQPGQFLDYFKNFRILKRRKAFLESLVEKHPEIIQNPQHSSDLSLSKEHLKKRIHDCY